MTKSSPGLPFRLVLVDLSGLTLQTADSAKGIATISRPVTGSGIYVIRVVNVGLSAPQVTTTTNAHITR